MSFFSLFCCWFVFVFFCFFFSFYFFQFQHFSLFFFFSVLSASVGSFSLVFFFFLLVCSCFFFLLLSIPASFFVLFVAVVLWCLKLQFTVTRFILSPWRTRLAQAPNRSKCYIVIYTFMHHNDTTSKTDAWRKKPEGRHRKISLTTFYLSFYCKGSKGLLKGCVWEGAGDRT